MIRLLTGKVHSHDERTIILLVNGVGYHVFVNAEFISKASVEPDELEEIVLYIHTHVREDDITLYGFRTKKELKLFELLLGVNGVGPKMALEISNHPAQRIQSAILNEDFAMLTKVPGVGKKTAERICLELKNKVDLTDISDLQNYEGSNETEVNEEVIITLETLGYKRHHINQVLSSIAKESKEELTETEEIIRLFLQNV
jgi:holliday junction DNA helicase RuvA